MTQPADRTADSSSMLHSQKLDVYQCSIEFVALAHRVRERLELLERIVAMLTKLIEP